ncbi:MAG: VCBS repeat-containing protein [Bacteroidota bacterium]
MPLAPQVHILDFELGDMDGDGDLDAVGAVEYGVNRLYLNDGTGHFTWKEGAFSENSYDSEEVELGDFDGDGHLDVVFIAEDDASPEFYLGNGDGTFRDVTDRLPGRSVANDGQVADLDGDGHLDIFVSSTGGSRDGRAPEWQAVRQNFFWRGDPERPGYFIDVTADRLPAINDASQDTKFGDLDGDGDLDMVIGNEVPPNRILINQGDGVFAEEPDRLDLPEPLETREVQLFDADGDGDLDIFFSNLTSNAREWEKNPQVRLLINDGTGHFTDETATRLPTNTFSSYDAGYLDVDADGDLDLLVCAVQIPSFSPLQVRAYLNDGTGDFTDATGEVIPAETVGRCWDVESADLDGDGTLDVIIGGWRTQARLLLGKKK